ncbi:MAG: hypothetical protein LDL44_04515 [Caenispirillum sp.]|nr:hypothetical protein [Caenispirillum sp.]
MSRPIITWTDRGKRVEAVPVGWTGTGADKPGRVLVMDAAEQFHLVELHGDGTATVMVGPITVDEALDQATAVLEGRPTPGAVGRQVIALAAGVHVLSCLLQTMGAEVRP